MTDHNDPVNANELKIANTNDLDFIKIWYAWNVTTTGTEQILGMSFLKFDLSDLNSNEIDKATLNMHTYSDNTWNESELNFTNKPDFIKEIAFAEINNVNDWISWNVTYIIKENTDSEITFSAY